MTLFDEIERNLDDNVALHIRCMPKRVIVVSLKWVLSMSVLLIGQNNCAKFYHVYSLPS